MPNDINLPAEEQFDDLLLSFEEYLPVLISKKEIKMIRYSFISMLMGSPDKFFQKSQSMALNCKNFWTSKSRNIRYQKIATNLKALRESLECMELNGELHDVENLQNRTREKIKDFLMKNFGETEQSIAKAIVNMIGIPPKEEPSPAVNTKSPLSNIIIKGRCERGYDKYRKKRAIRYTLEEQ